MHIFLDACIVIYWVEASEPFYSTLLSKLEHINKEYPHHTLAVSRLSLLECLVKPLQEKNEKMLGIYKKFFELPGLSMIEINAQVVDIATTLRAYHKKLRTPDALQAAACLSIRVPHLFLTNDKHFKDISGLKVALI